jgi:hypothetical protein
VGEAIQPPAKKWPAARIRYAGNETNYCANCQTRGRVLADRGLSRLLGADGPARSMNWRICGSTELRAGAE